MFQNQARKGSQRLERLIESRVEIDRFETAGIGVVPAAGAGVSFQKRPDLGVNILNAVDEEKVILFFVLDPQKRM